MRVKLLSTGAHAPWQKGEIVTVQVVDTDDTGAYDVETIETYPADLKDQHAAVIQKIHDHYAEQHGNIVASHQAELAELRRVITEKDEAITRLSQPPPQGKLPA